MRILISALAVTVLWLNSCGVLPWNNHRDYLRKDYTPSVQDTLLLRAFKTGDRAYFDSLLAQWYADSKPISDSEYATLSDTLRAVYDLVREYYTWNLGLVKPHQYQLIPNHISRAIVDSSTFDWIERGNPEAPDQGANYVQLDNFRPAVISNRQKVLYFVDSYVCTMNYFFNETDGDSDVLGEKGRKTFEAKMEYISDRLPRWGYITTCFRTSFLGPYVSSIVLDKKLSRGILYVVSQNRGSYEEYVKSDAGWTYLRELEFYFY